MPSRVCHCVYTVVASTADLSGTAHKVAYEVAGYLHYDLKTILEQGRYFFRDRMGWLEADKEDSHGRAESGEF